MIKLRFLDKTVKSAIQMCFLSSKNIYLVSCVASVLFVLLKIILGHNLFEVRA